MKLAILGSRGIPNHYGGFEQFAGYLSAGLAQMGTDVWVYCSHNHPFKGNSLNGVNLIHCYDPEYLIGQAGQYIYDLNCILDSRNRDFDIILQLGYTSNSIWHRLLPSKSVIITNMDGLEWARSKYNFLTRRLLKYAEKLAVNSSHCLVADSVAIQKYIRDTYNKPSFFIPYGAEIFETPDEGVIERLGLVSGKYYLVVARLQPDNHIEEIIQGVLASGTTIPLIIIGNTCHKYGRYLMKKYPDPLIRFYGPEFNRTILDNLRYFASLYFHGHSAGGTNPSLLEAMAASARICAHDNPFNRSVLAGNACYFTDKNSIALILRVEAKNIIWPVLMITNQQKIRTNYRWEDVISAYHHVFETENSR